MASHLFSQMTDNTTLRTEEEYQRDTTKGERKLFCAIVERTLGDIGLYLQNVDRPSAKILYIPALESYNYLHGLKRYKTWSGPNHFLSFNYIMQEIFGHHRALPALKIKKQYADLPEPAAYPKHTIYLLY